MLVLSKAQLVFLAVPKTGTTAVEMELRAQADIAFSKNRKHITAQRYHRKVAPFLLDTFGVTPETVAVMRAPTDQLRSWYKYRTAASQKRRERSTAGMTFDAFVEAVISPNPPDFANVGSQWNFLTNASGEVLVDHLFAYSAQPVFLEFLSNRLGREVTLKQKNVSPETPAPLSDQMADRLRAARREEFDLYDKLTANGGYLGLA